MGPAQNSVSDQMIINVGKINGQRIATFHKPSKRIVAKWAQPFVDDFMPIPESGMVTPHEAFRRWKAARKAWANRRERGQLQLRLTT